MQKIGFFGPQGTYSEEAATRLNRTVQGELVPYDTIFDVIKAVENNAVQMGVIPIENSLEGSVSATLDVMASSTSDLKIVQELDLRIKHHLIGRASMKLKDVKEIISHPQALAQCQKYIYKNFNKCPTHQSSSTARAVEMIKRPGYKNFAAIGSELALKYQKGVKILDADISDSKTNETRFVVIAKNQMMPTGNDKTSIMFKIAKDRPGGLYSVLGELRKTNLAKIESRPNKTGIGDYIFFIDLEGHMLDRKVAKALNKIKKKVLQLKILGSYPVYSEKKNA